MAEETVPTYVVHKHPFPLNHKPFSLAVFPDASIARVAHQAGEPSATACLWEVHRTDVIRPMAMPRRWFVVRGTGDSILGDARWIDTWDEGPWVWHLFEVEAPESVAQDG